MTTKKPSQSAQILEYLQTGNELTALGALERFHCFRLAARINELVKQGHPIDSRLESVQDGVRVAVYSMECPF